MLDPCVVSGRTQLPRVDNATYVVAIDPAFRQSDFALAILHRTREGSIVVDRVANWTGTKKAPLGFESICQEIARIVKLYGIRDVVGDQYCFPVIREYFDTLGIRYREYTFGAHTRAELFGNLRALLTQRKIELLDEPTLLRQLRALEECKGKEWEHRHSAQAQSRRCGGGRCSRGVRIVQADASPGTLGQSDFSIAVPQLLGPRRKGMDSDRRMVTLTNTKFRSLK